jgi:hypothetical protein
MNQLIKTILKAWLIILILFFLGFFVYDFKYNPMTSQSYFIMKNAVANISNISMNYSQNGNLSIKLLDIPRL